MPKSAVVLTADMVSELLEQKQFTHLYTLLKEMRAEDIAPLFENLEPTDAVRLFRLLPERWQRIRLWNWMRRSRKI